MLFPQAEQVIRRDNFQIGTLRLLLLLLFCISASIWLLLGTLTFYTASYETKLTADNYVQARFNQTQLDAIVLGQIAEVQFADTEGNPITAPAIVLEIIYDTGLETGDILLLVTDDEAYVALFGEETAVIEQVRIQQNPITPFQFILSAAGLIKEAA